MIDTETKYKKNSHSHGVMRDCIVFRNTGRCITRHNYTILYNKILYNEIKK